MVKPWGEIGAWAEEAERADEEAKELAEAAAAAAGREEGFPILGELVVTTSVGKQQQHGKKKKAQKTISLSELLVGKNVGPGGAGKGRQASDSRGSEEERQHGGRAGGFRAYGEGFKDGMAEGGGRDHNRGGFDQNRQAGGYRTDRDGNAGGYGGQMDRDGESASSRADESRDWGASKKHMPWQAGQHYGDERRGNRANDQELPSRADEVDNWSSLKKFVISQGLDRKALPPHSEERKGGFEEGAGPRIVSRADEAGSWGAGKKFVSGEREGTDLVHKSGGMPQVDESRPVERPRLILLPRSQIVDASVPSAIPSKETPVGKGSEILESDPSMPDIQLPKPKPRSNPFGAARPREEILAEKGQDWRKFEAELENREREIRNSLPSTPDGAPQRWTRLPLKYEPHGQGRENSRPSSSHSSRPQTPDLSAQLGTKSRAKVNPFGDAKPREILLEEKGKDWRRIDFELEHRSVERCGIISRGSEFRACACGT
ncbi:hypothetical protein O6H91_08G105200 [Diphasiastrum complanatum]|uniref:Uncharacterized protein n=1 Tax=Diphasiastrum complanatum TaxID=34168 RepID=A0ACC2D0G8_DIPCM|nr:hypothetical protein O6H91_08G105200 [Diphasiastrum complanatum]